PFFVFCRFYFAFYQMLFNNPQINRYLRDNSPIPE
ncbi:MAG: hypothetical protein ACI8SJ_002763, partial [Shewanella sp.]